MQITEPTIKMILISQKPEKLQRWIELDRKEFEQNIGNHDGQSSWHQSQKNRVKHDCKD